MTFYSAKRKGDILKITMNPFLRGTIIFLLVSVLVSLVLEMNPGEFDSLPLAGKVGTILIPTLLFLGSAYRYDLVFDRRNQSISLYRGVFFLNGREDFSFEDLTGVNYRVFDPSRDSTQTLTRYIRRPRADFGLFIKGKHIQLEKGAPLKEVEGLFITFRTFFPKLFPVI